MSNCKYKKDSQIVGYKTLSHTEYYYNIPRGIKMEIICDELNYRFEVIPVYKNYLIF